MTTLEFQAATQPDPQLRKSYPRRERTAPPVHPGKILLSEFMHPMDLTVEELAARTGHAAPYIEAFIHEEERVSETFAQALGQVLGTSAGLWLNLQRSTDDFAAKQVSR